MEASRASAASSIASMNSFARDRRYKIQASAVWHGCRSQARGSGLGNTFYLTAVTLWMMTA